MTAIVGLLIGIAMAGALFAAWFWSFAQLFQATGRLRVAHGVLLVLIIAGALVVTYKLVGLSPTMGVLLTAGAAVVVALETGLSRLLPLAPLAFGVALILRLPFAAV